MSKKKDKITAKAVIKGIPGARSRGKDLFAIQRKLRFGYHEKSCHNCRYFRIGDGAENTLTITSGSYCLFLGRPLGIHSQISRLLDWAMARICDAWKKRPSTWSIYSKDPFWHDKYIPRETQERFRQ